MEDDSETADLVLVLYMRNFTRLAETRLAQSSLEYLNILLNCIFWEIVGFVCVMYCKL